MGAGGAGTTGPGRPADGAGGGRGLAGRLVRALPLAVLAGLAAGIPLAVWTRDWRLALMLALGVPAVVGLVLPATLDGRVRHAVDGGTAPRPGAGVDPAATGYPERHEQPQHAGSGRR
ncbi:MAG: hypothetical protein MUE51_05630 [Thermoleophilia bacterium]|jgi:hypothetical protein|nr:hypothetical protein [Thermoleophilia bacterium]